ncbi:MFS transporter [Candidatus Aerophobetes bacterium]|nr:MFS transporter [Candidatus Aerophobetes bacterium]
MEERSRILGVLFLDHFVNDFYSVFIPIFIPALVLNIGINYFEASILVSVVAIIGAVLQSPLGYWADLYRKRVVFMLLGFLFYALGAITLGLSGGFTLLFLSSVLIGLAATTYHPQGTNLITKNFSRKGRALGVHGVGGQLGRFVSPFLIGFLISQFGWRKAALFLSLPALIAIFFSRLALREPEERGEKGFTKAITFPILLLILILGIRGAVFQGVLSFLPSFFVSAGSSINIAGVLTGIMLGSGLIAQLIGGIMGDRVSKSKIIFFSLLGLTLIFSLFYIMMIHIVRTSVINYWLLIAPLFGIGFCIFTTFPIGLALSAELTQGERVGTSVGIVLGGGMILPSLTLPVIGYLIDNFGFVRGFSVLVILSLIATIISGFYLKWDFASEK